MTKTRQKHFQFKISDFLLDLFFLSVVMQQKPSKKPTKFHACTVNKTMYGSPYNKIVVHRWRCRANYSQPYLGPIKFIILYPNSQSSCPVIFFCPFVINERIFSSLELMKYASPSGKSSKKLQTH